MGFFKRGKCFWQAFFGVFVRRAKDVCLGEGNGGQVLLASVCCDRGEGCVCLSVGGRVVGLKILHLFAMIRTIR